MKEKYGNPYKWRREALKNGPLPPAADMTEEEERNMKIILDITDEEYEVLRDYGTSLKSEDGHELRAPLKRGAEQALREWVAWKAAEKKERHE